MEHELRRSIFKKKLRYTGYWGAVVLSWFLANCMFVRAQPFFAAPFMLISTVGLFYCFGRIVRARKDSFSADESEFIERHPMTWL